MNKPIRLRGLLIETLKRNKNGDEEIGVYGKVPNVEAEISISPPDLIEQLKKQGQELFMNFIANEWRVEILSKEKDEPMWCNCEEYQIPRAIKDTTLKCLNCELPIKPTGGGQGRTKKYCSCEKPVISETTNNTFCYTCRKDIKPTPDLKEIEDNRRSKPYEQNSLIWQYVIMTEGEWTGRIFRVTAYESVPDEYVLYVGRQKWIDKIKRNQFEVLNELIRRVNDT